MPKQGSGGREERLYHVAASLFNQQGYGSTHVRQICRTLEICSTTSASGGFSAAWSR
jgi:AcrR family transcriptional regulator